MDLTGTYLERNSLLAHHVLRALGITPALGVSASLTGVPLLNHWGFALDVPVLDLWAASELRRATRHELVCGASLQWYNFDFIVEANLRIVFFLLWSSKNLRLENVILDWLTLLILDVLLILS